MLPLAHGGAIVVIGDPVRESPRLFWDALARTEVISWTAAVVSGRRHSRRPGRPALDHLVLGGESFTTELRQEIARRLDIGRLINLYGPTEATIDAVGWSVAGDEAARSADRPSAVEHRVYVLDGGLEPAPAGWWGSCTLRGRGWRAAMWGVRI